MKYVLAAAAVLVSASCSPKSQVAEDVSAQPRQGSQTSPGESKAVSKNQKVEQSFKKAVAVAYHVSESDVDVDSINDKGYNTLEHFNLGALEALRARVSGKEVRGFADPDGHAILEEEPDWTAFAKGANLLDSPPPDESLTESLGWLLRLVSPEGTLSKTDDGVVFEIIAIRHLGTGLVEHQRVTLEVKTDGEAWLKTEVLGKQ